MEIIKKTFISLTILIVLGITSFVINLTLLPFWNWFENTTGIESVGHGFVATWCLVAVFVILVSIFFGIRAFLIFLKTKEDVK